MMGSGQTQLLD